MIDVNEGLIDKADRTELKENIKNRLSYLGYELKNSDEWTVNFLIDKVENSIKNKCNINIIPKMLEEAETDMICGEFLLYLKNSGNLDIENINIDAAVKSIQEGDTSISYSDKSKTPEERLDLIINYLMKNKTGDLIRYRRIVW